MSVSRYTSTSQLNKSWVLIPAAALLGSCVASIAALFLIPRLRNATSAIARGRAEPVSRPSPFDIEYPPAD